MANSQVEWLNYLFFCDFSTDKDALEALPLGEVSQDTATLLAATLSSHDQGEGRAQWVDKANPEWGLLGASISYNGPNQTGFASNGAYDRILILQFPDSQVKPQGMIVLNYNTGETTPPATPQPDASPTDNSASSDSADSTPTA